jgi:hypothetical protein
LDKDGINNIAKHGNVIPNSKLIILNDKMFVYNTDIKKSMKNIADSPIVMTLLTFSFDFLVSA